MILWCANCGEETEHEEQHEDRFDPGSWSGHYTVSVGMVCLKCDTEYEEDDWP